MALGEGGLTAIELTMTTPGATATAAGSALVDAKSLKEENWAAITAKAFVAASAAAEVK